MFKRLTRLAPVLLIILLPWFFYWFLSGGKHKARQIGYYGPKTPVTTNVDGKVVNDTIYHVIKNFKLTDIDGRLYPYEDLSKYLHVIGTFELSSNTSLTLFEKLFFLQEELKGKSDVRILMVNAKPQVDSAEAVRNFISGKIIDRSKWFVLTGSIDETKNLLTNSLFLLVGVENTPVSDQLYLIDKNKNIRGIYDGTDEVELKRLFDEIKVLRLEYVLSKKQ